MLSTLLKKKNIFYINTSTNKKTVLEKLIETIYNNNIEQLSEISIDKIKESIFYREELMSTGIGLGLAIPHVRLNDIKDMYIAMAIAPNGIDDYEAIDNEKVKIVLMIIAGANMHKEHIKLLNNFVKSYKNDNLEEKIFKAKNQEDIIKIWTKENI